MSKHTETFGRPQSVTIEVRRWDAFITIVDEKGQKHEFVASADSSFTFHDGIWFGRKAEHDEGPLW